MKFLDLTELELVNHALDFVSSDCHVIGRIETYSCKATTYDKKLSKQLNSRFSCSTSPNREEQSSLKQFNSLNDNYFLNSSLESSLGSSLGASAVKKIFCYLISTMNSAFPDYDFSYLQPKNFIHFESAEMVINSINQTLISSGGQELVNCSGLWEAINPIIEFKDCDVFSFVPDFDSEPFSGPGAIWYFNYFFYNRKLKRILFFTCTGFSLKVNPYDEALGSSISEYGHVNDGFDYEEVVMADIEL